MTDEWGPVGVPVDAPAMLSEDDAKLVDLLRAGDADAFARVVEEWSPSMLRLARGHVSTDASAEEMVQEAWLGVIRGLDRFEGRSSLKTWVFRILTNQAKSRGVREARAVPWSSLGPEDEGPTVDPERFRGPDDQWPGGWTLEGRPTAWEPSPESSAIAGEIRVRLGAALQELPERQRVVVSLRDVDGLSSDEVCTALGITAANQRVLLHRGRARLRTVLEGYYRDFMVGCDRVSQDHDDTDIDIACRQFVEIVTDFLEGALDPATSRAVERHLELCPHCNRYVEQMRETIATVGHVPVETLSDQAKADLVAAFRDFHAPG